MDKKKILILYSFNGDFKNIARGQMAFRHIIGEMVDEGRNMSTLSIDEATFSDRSTARLVRIRDKGLKDALTFTHLYFDTNITKGEGAIEAGELYKFAERNGIEYVGDGTYFYNGAKVIEFDIEDSKYIEKNRKE